MFIHVSEMKCQRAKEKLATVIIMLSMYLHFNDCTLKVPASSTQAHRLSSHSRHHLYLIRHLVLQISVGGVKFFWQLNFGGLLFPTKISPHKNLTYKILWSQKFLHLR